MAGEGGVFISLTTPLILLLQVGLPHVTSWNSYCHFRPPNQMAAALILRPLLPHQALSNLEAFPRNRLAKGTRNRRHSCRKRSAPPLVASASATGATGTADGTNGNERERPSSAAEFGTTDDIKAALYQALTGKEMLVIADISITLCIQGIDRGIFGATSSKKSEIAGLVELLESRNPTPYPTDDLRDKV
ncbi:hypothetical protein BHM03_00019680 [Ensete ventricosum]|nr:hypothetical protein BHM03_00019680 [Ensete ventricosum]